MAIETKTNSLSNTAPKWHRVYYLLAIFDVLIVVFSLFLNHHLISIQRESVKDNEIWVNRLDDYLAFRKIANKVSQPGDDVFATHDSKSKRQKMENYLISYNQEFKRFMDKIEEVPPRFRQKLIEDLTQIDNRVQKMAVQCRKIFDYYDLDDAVTAGGEMAKMDQMLGDVNDGLSILHSDVIQIQHELLTEESNYVSGIQKYEFVSAIFVLLMISGALFYGSKIRRKIEDTNKEKELFIKELQTAHQLLKTTQDELEQKVKERTAELSESKEFVENIFSSMADMLFAVDDDGKIERVNESAIKMLGYSEEELLNQNVSILTRRKTFLTKTEFEFMLKNRVLDEVEKEIVCKNGEKIPVLISSSILKGRKSAAVVVAKDITKLKQGEQKLREYSYELKKSNEEYEILTESYKQLTEDLQKSEKELISALNFNDNIMNSMVDFVVLIDLDLNIIKVNPAALKLNGYEEYELLGKSINTIVGDKPFTANSVEIIKRLGSINNFEKLHKAKDGTLLQISLSMSVVKDNQGNPSGIVCVGKDTSESIKARKAIEESNERLRQSNRELEEFAYVASHDLQEPLRKIQAFGDRLKKKYSESLNEEGQDYVSRMGEAAGRMQRLINDLLTFSRVSSKAQPFESVDFSKIAEEVISDLEVRIEETDGNIEIGKLPQIDADPIQIRQLMQNLIGNALKFTQAGKKPKIKIYSQEFSDKSAAFVIDGKKVETINNANKMCQIVVQDNGIGFDEKYLDRIFTVFQRLHGRTEYEGSGVGLAVCRKIVERHRGTITAKSKEGEGATFLITLPVSQKETLNNERM